MEITLSILLQLVQTIGILVGIIYYITIMRNTQRNQELSLKVQEDAERARQREMIFLRFQSFDLPYARAWGDVMYKDVSTIEEWREVYDPRVNLDTYANMVFLQNRYQSLGIMLRERVISPEMLFQLFNPASIMLAWEHYKVSILYRRENDDQPNLFDGFEYLAEEASKMLPEFRARARIHEMR